MRPSHGSVTSRQWWKSLLPWASSHTPLGTSRVLLLHCGGKNVMSAVTWAPPHNLAGVEVRGPGPPQLGGRRVYSAVCGWRRVGRASIFCARPVGISESLASSAPCPGHSKQKDTPGTCLICWYLNGPRNLAQQADRGVSSHLFPGALLIPQCPTSAGHVCSSLDMEINFPQSEVPGHYNLSEL